MRYAIVDGDRQGVTGLHRRCASPANMKYVYNICTMISVLKSQTSVINIIKKQTRLTQHSETIYRFGFFTTSTIVY